VTHPSNRPLSAGFHILSSLLILSGAWNIAGCKSSNDEAVARVGNSVITASDFKARLQDTPPAYQQYATTSEGRRQFLNLLMREKVILAESKKEGLARETTYKDALKRFKEKQKRDLTGYKDTLLIEMFLSHLRTKKLNVTDADIRRYYDEHREEFDKPVEIQASHILVQSSDEAERALARIKSGESFDSVAKAVSMDPATATRGGKLMPFTRGSLMPEFENAVFPLKEGELSGVVKSSFGYHIIKKTGQKTLPAQSFEQARDQIQNRLQREKFDQWVTSAQAKLGVKIDENALAAFTATPGAPVRREESVQ
jgi:peptidyl-prolyl cis-trans isomerase C